MTSPAPPSRRIFVSHASEDSLFARSFVALLREMFKLNHPDDIFFDEDSLLVGEEFVPRIESEILARPIFVVVVTEHAVASEWVKFETQYAMHLRLAADRKGAPAERRAVRRLIVAVKA